jgi:hypothetical protein
MRWVRMRKDSDESFWLMDDNGDVRIPSDEKWENYGVLDQTMCFRPDLDWNHLAEVIAEAERREWRMELESEPGRDKFATIRLWRDIIGGKSQSVCGKIRAIYSDRGMTINEAFLRAFVAASEAEKGRGS